MISILQGEALGFPYVDSLPRRGSALPFYQGSLVYAILIWMYLRRSDGSYLGYSSEIGRSDEPNQCLIFLNLPDLRYWALW
jgi:hypothetical protein